MSPEYEARAAKALEMVRAVYYRPNLSSTEVKRFYELCHSLLKKHKEDVNKALNEFRERDSHHFLNCCMSKPLTLGELEPETMFIFFPSDGDDSGHGGFRGGPRIFIKSSPIGDSTYRHYFRPEVEGSASSICPVLRLANS